MLAMSIDEAKRVLWREGAEAHRFDKSTDEFAGDPVLGLYTNMLNGSNYLDEMVRRGVTIPTFIGAAIRSCAQWAREIHQERTNQ